MFLKRKKGNRAKIRMGNRVTASAKASLLPYFISRSQCLFFVANSLWPFSCLNNPRKSLLFKISHPSYISDYIACIHALYSCEPSSKPLDIIITIRFFFFFLYILDGSISIIALDKNTKKNRRSFFQLGIENGLSY